MHGHAVAMCAYNDAFILKDKSYSQELLLRLSNWPEQEKQTSKQYVCICYIILPID